MSAHETIRIPAIKASSFEIEYRESFGLIEAETPSKRIAEEREFFVVKEGGISFLVKGTLYPLQEGDVIMLAPHEYFHILHHGETPFRYYRVLVSEDLIDAAFPALRECSILRKARFCFPGAVRNKLFAICERLLSGENEASLYHIMHFLHILCRHRAAYTEEDAVIEAYEQCLPKELRKVMLYVRNHTRSPFSLSETAEACGLGEVGIAKLFKTHLGVTAKEYADGIRAAEASHLLLCDHTVDEVAHLLGYSGSAALTESFKRLYSTTPLKYKKSGIVYHLDL